MLKKEKADEKTDGAAAEESKEVDAALQLMFQAQTADKTSF